jgi:hypothetical protein
MRRKYFRLKKMAIGLAFAAVLVPTAQAKPVSSTPSAQTPIASETSVQSPVFVPSRHLPQADIQAISQAPVSEPKLSPLRYRAMERAYLNQPGTISSAGAINGAKDSVSSVSGPAVQATQADGFNWGDAGIGASVVFGAALILLMAAVLGRRMRSRPTGLAKA